MKGFSLTLQLDTQRFIVAMTLIGLFSYAYVHSPSQEMTGALIAAFSGGWGFYLGSSTGAAKANDNVGKALDVANSVTPTTDTTDTLKVAPGDEKKIVGVDDGDGSGN